MNTEYYLARRADRHRACIGAKVDLNHQSMNVSTVVEIWGSKTTIPAKQVEGMPPIAAVWRALEVLQRQLAIFAFFLFVATANPAHAVFIASSSGDLYELEIASNTSTLLGNSGVGAMYDIALDPTSGSLYGVTGAGSLYSLDKTNGAATLIGSTGTFINGLTFDSSGTLFASGGSRLYTVDLLTGAATFVGNIGFTSSGDLAFDPFGNLYMSATGPAGDRLISVDPVTGAGTLVGDIGYFFGVYGLNFMGSTLYGFTFGGQTISIDTSTGAGTLVALNGIIAYGADGAGGVTGTEPPPVPVPEPAGISLLAIGLLGLRFTRKLIV